MHRIIFHNFDAKLPMTHRLWQVLNYAKTRTVLLCRLMAPPSIMQIPCKQQLPANVINLHLRRINVLSSNQPNFRYIDRKWLKWLLFENDDQSSALTFSCWLNFTALHYLLKSTNPMAEGLTFYAAQWITL